MNRTLLFWSVSHPARTHEVPSLAFVKAIHSSGASQRIRVVSGALEPVAPPGSADVVVLAPAWPLPAKGRPLEGVVAEAVDAMAPGGMLYAIAPRRLRPRILRLLRKHGLEIRASRLHLRSGAARYYIPLTARSLRFALDSWPLGARWDIFVRILDLFPGSARILALLLPAIGFGACRPGTRPFAWLLSRLPIADTEALVATSWRLTEASALVFGFAGHDKVPSIVAKQAPPSKRSAAFHEWKMLGKVASNAEAAGVLVPRLVELLDGPGQTYLLETGVPGRPLAGILAGHPGDLSTVVQKLSIWLEAWHRDSIQRAPLTSAECNQMILGPASSLLETLHFGTEYLAWLREATSRLIGKEVPWVNTHNDLTMANVLQDQDGRIAVVDWEAARMRGMPLADFWYGVCDAATACGSQDRARMFNQCFLEGGMLNSLVAPLDRRLREIVGGPPEWIELCFHACWLEHAANEQLQRIAGEDSPFLAIVNALAESALDYEGSGASPPAARNRLRGISARPFTPSQTSESR